MRATSYVLVSNDGPQYMYSFLSGALVTRDGWMTRFYVLFNSIPVISGQWADDK